MGQIGMPGGGGGIDLDVITAEAGDIVSGKVGLDKEGEPLAGTLELTGNAAVGHVLKGKTFYNTNPKTKNTGTMEVSSVLSFSIAAYSTSQLTFTWKNPAQASGRPFSGVIICCKTGSYPTSPNDGYKYMGAGNNSAASGTSSVTLSGFTAGTTYYCRIWAYCICSAGGHTVNSTKVLVSESYKQATGKPTAHGRQVFTASGTFTVPAGVRSINIHCTGAGQKGDEGDSSPANSRKAGGGGGGGYVAWKNSISVAPGDTIAVIVGAGSTSVSSAAPSSSASKNGTVLVTANGAGALVASSNGYYFTGGPGGSGGGGAGYSYDSGSESAWDKAGNGGSNGSNGSNQGYNGNAADSGVFTSSSSRAGKGSGKTTREFGASSGTLHGGAGGGGWCGSAKSTGAGGAGGGGAGGGASSKTNYIAGVDGSAGTGGGGGGNSHGRTSGKGGSGNVIFTW